jgi:6-phosphogluconolactonase
MIVLFGTYAPGDQQGIYAAQFDPQSGRLGPARRAADLPNPGFFALARDQRTLVAVGRGAAGTPLAEGRIAALRLDPATGNAELLNELPTQGRGPCHVALHPNGRFAAVANYGDGSVEVFQLDVQGRLERQTAYVAHHGSSVDPERQEGPHAHSANFDPAGRFLLVCDLGLDQVLAYPFQSDAGNLGPPIEPVAHVPAGHGPRHLAFHPGGRWAYVVNEMGGSVTHCLYDANRGILTPQATVDALPAGYADPRRAAEILVHPAGHVVYCSHRGEDTVAALAIDPQQGTLRRLGAASTGGGWPRNFALDPTGKWIVAANQNGDNATVLHIADDAGAPVAADGAIAVPQPVCVRFIRPAG